MSRHAAPPRGTPAPGRPRGPRERTSCQLSVHGSPIPGCQKVHRAGTTSDGRPAPRRRCQGRCDCAEPSCPTERGAWSGPTASCVVRAGGAHPPQLRRRDPAGQPLLVAGGIIAEEQIAAGGRGMVSRIAAGVGEVDVGVGRGDRDAARPGSSGTLRSATVPMSAALLLSGRSAGSLGVAGDGALRDEPLAQPRRGQAAVMAVPVKINVAPLIVQASGTSAKKSRPQSAANTICR